MSNASRRFLALLLCVCMVLAVSASPALRWLTQAARPKAVALVMCSVVTPAASVLSRTQPQPHSCPDGGELLCCQPTLEADTEISQAAPGILLMPVPHDAWPAAGNPLLVVASLWRAIPIRAPPAFFPV